MIMCPERELRGEGILSTYLVVLARNSNRASKIDNVSQQ